METYLNRSGLPRNAGAGSSVRQSIRLLTERSRVQIPSGPLLLRALTRGAERPRGFEPGSERSERPWFKSLPALLLHPEQPASGAVASPVAPVGSRYWRRVRESSSSRSGAATDRRRPGPGPPATVSGALSEAHLGRLVESWAGGTGVERCVGQTVRAGVGNSRSWRRGTGDDERGSAARPAVDDALGLVVAGTGPDEEYLLARVDVREFDRVTG